MYKCWNCQADLQNPMVCANCNSVQPLHPTNPFETMGLAPEFDISTKTLSRNYLERQQLIHPDKFVSKSSQEKLYAQQHSSYINQCYQILDNTVSRAEALLEYHNHPLESAESTVQDPVLLHESMGFREKLMLIESKDQLVDFKKDIEKHIQETTQDIKSCMDDTKDFDQAKRSVIRLKYLNKLLTEINQKEMTYS